jgi:hypothetical protein
MPGAGSRATFCRVRAPLREIPVITRAIRDEFRVRIRVKQPLVRGEAAHPGVVPLIRVVVDTFLLPDELGQLVNDRPVARFSVLDRAEQRRQVDGVDAHCVAVRLARLPAAVEATHPGVGDHVIRRAGGLWSGSKAAVPRKPPGRWKATCMRCSTLSTNRGASGSNCFLRPLQRVSRNGVDAGCPNTPKYAVQIRHLTPLIRVIIIITRTLPKSSRRYCMLALSN